jgi:hypothetical protein
VGSSGGIIVIWNGSLFYGEITFQNEFSLSINFKSLLSNESWILTNIYGPCLFERKALFLDWFTNIDMPDNLDWIVLGDFNFTRKPSDRNKPGGDINDMLLFNDAISSLGLVELPLKGRQFTWSNMEWNKTLYWKDWIGSLLQVLGHFHIHQLLCTLCQGQLQTMYHVLYQLVQRSPKLNYSGLRITSFSTVISRI